MNAPGGVIPTERAVQRAILKMLPVCFPGAVAHHSPNGAHLAGSETARFKQVGALRGDGMLRGFPDLIVLWDGGMKLLEVKRLKGSVISPEQKALHERLSAIGWPVAVVRSPDDAHAALCAAGAPCRGEMT